MSMFWWNAVLGGLGNAMTPGDEKDRLMMALIADKAVKLTSKGGFATLLDPHGGRTASAGLGALMTNLMNRTVHLVSDLVGALRCQPPQPLGEKVDITRLRNQAPNNEAG